MARGRDSEAVGDLEKSLSLDPESVATLMSLASIRGTSSDERVFNLVEAYKHLIKVRSLADDPDVLIAVQGAIKTLEGIANRSR